MIAELRKQHFVRRYTVVVRKDCVQHHAMSDSQDKVVVGLDQAFQNSHHALVPACDHNQL